MQLNDSRHWWAKLVAVINSFTRSRTITLFLHITQAWVVDMVINLAKSSDRQTLIHKTQTSSSKLLSKFRHLEDTIRQNDAAVDQSTDMADDMRRSLLPVFCIIVLWKVARIGLYCHMAVMPATSCSAERSFSEPRRMKTYLRVAPWTRLTQQSCFYQY